MPDYSKGNPTPKSQILIEFKTLNTVVFFSAKAKTGDIFVNSQNVIPLRHLLETVFLNPQPKEGSSIIIDNLTLIGILTKINQT